MILKNNPKEDILNIGLYALYNKANFIFVILDTTLKVVRLNPYFSELLGYSSDAIMDKEFLDLNFFKWESDVIKATSKENIFKNDESAINIKVETSFKHELTLKIFLVKTYDTKNEFIGFSCIAADETERESLEERLKETALELENQNKFLEDNKRAMLNILDDSLKLEEDLQTEREHEKQKIEELTKLLNEEKSKNSKFNEKISSL